MSAQKSKSIQNLEDRMRDLDPASLRYQVLDSARQFKRSWIDLGGRLFAVFHDKRFREWGYLTFEAYCAKEIGIRQATAMKLLRSYAFLEREEPSFLKSASLENKKPSQIPSYESVNALRLAKQSRRIPEGAYEELRQAVLDNAREDTEVKRKIRFILRTQAGAADENPRERRAALVKKMILQLQSARNEMLTLDFPEKVINQIEKLMEFLQSLRGVP